MTTVTTPVGAGPALTLRRLYAVRSGFALVWAVLVFATASGIGPLTAVLLVAYPVFDVAAAVVDVRSSRGSAAGGSGNGAVAGLYVNIAISTLAAVGLVFVIAAGSGVPGVLRVWGVWAVVAGLVQLVVAVRRRRLGGQWAMIASGAISVLAGISFVLMASNAGATSTRISCLPLAFGCSITKNGASRTACS